MGVRTKLGELDRLNWRRDFGIARPVPRLLELNSLGGAIQ
jgi:hypothetical protein